ncbi:MAG: hypothetical protein ACRDGJ_06775 [Candidatus Limnocylindria bacterium]
MTAAVRPGRGRARGGAAIAAPDLDAAIAAAEGSAVIIWRGARLSYAAVPARIAHTSGRADRFALFNSYAEAAEAINPLREARLERLTQAARAAGDDDLVSAAPELAGYDPEALSAGLQRFMDESETVYFAAVRRYLALIDIEQGDAMVADLWHVLEGSGWNQWFDTRRVSSALRATTDGLGWGPPPETDTTAEVSPWGAAGARLRAATGVVEARDAAGRTASAGVAALLAALLMDPVWLTGELGMGQAEVVGFTDFAAFARLWRLRRDAALLAYELRLYRAADAALRRAYFAGMVGLMTGVAEPEALYLAAVDRPWAAGARLRAELLAAAALDALRDRHGTAWWLSPPAGSQVQQLAAAPSAEDMLAQLGYDRLDWRPVLRQIRTQLIGEMSGYGGPNITTRAGTRKV